MPKIFAREEELKILEDMYRSKKAELLAIYGRRRVGKTFLIKEFFGNKINSVFLKVTGTKKGLMKVQLENFIQQVGEVFYRGASLAIPKNWHQALSDLHKAIKEIPKSQKIILFFDELPWLATRNSRLLESLEYYWNQHWSDDPRLKLIVCGSSSSWIIKKFIKDKGGFHNRVSKKIHLSPFTLKETSLFLKGSGIKLNNEHILSVYMAVGGIPFYLTHIEKGLSSSEIIEQLAFSKNSFFLKEFDDIFASLFDNAHDYVTILRIIANKQYGLGQEELLQQLDKSLQGQRGLDILNDLEEADFIRSFKPHFHKRRGVYYRVMDEYTVFYFKWIEPIRKTLQESSLGKGNWQEIQNSSAWHSWAGYAFESICYKHISEIRRALKIPASAIADTWRYVPKKKSPNQGAQIDLLFDRRDNAITLCEIKYTENPFTLTKEYVKQLLQKEAVLKQHTGTQKQLFWVFISTAGMKNTFYADEFISDIVTLNDLF